MKTHNLIAIAAAALITFANVNVVDFNVASQPVTSASSHARDVIDLAPVHVRPSAAEMRAAALLTDIGTAGIATVPAMIRVDGAGKTQALNQFSAQLAMPYYSFGKQFGSVSKE